MERYIAIYLKNPKITGRKSIRGQKIVVEGERKILRH